MATLLFTSCTRDSIEEDSLEATNLLVANPTTTNCSETKINPLFYSERVKGINGADHKVKRLNQYCNPIYVQSYNYFGYVTSNKIVSYDRTVQVFYSYKGNKTCKLKAGGGDEEIIGAELFKIPANSNKSYTRPILRNLEFEGYGSVTSRVGSVVANNEFDDCYEGTKITSDFVNPYTEPIKPKLGLEDRFDPEYENPLEPY